MDMEHKNDKDTDEHGIEHFTPEKAKHQRHDPALRAAAVGDDRRLHARGLRRDERGAQDEREHDGSIRDTTVAYLGVDVLFRRLDEEKEKHGDCQRHQNRLQIDQGEVDDHADDGHTGSSGSF